MARWTRIWLAVLAIGLAGKAAVAQGIIAPVAQPQTVEAALQQMAARAGVIFAGEVTAIRQPESETGMVEVDFQVDAAIRGCTVGIYVLREWSGLWGAGMEQRYRIGESVLVLLHAPGPSGLSSPVDGMDGILPIAGSGAAPGPLDTTVAPGSTMVDMRWIQTHIVRAGTNGGTLTPVHRIDMPGNGGLEATPLAEAQSGNQIQAQPFAPVPFLQQQTVVPQALPGQGSTMSSNAVLSLLRSWESERNGSL